MRTDPSSTTDARALDALRTQAAANPRGAARQAAVQFESLFMNMVVKSMRDATPKAEGSSSGQDTFTGMLDQQFAKQFAGRPGGLADMLEKQLTRHLQNLPPVSAENQAAAAAAAQAQAAAAGAQPSTAASGVAPTGRPASFIRDMLPHAQEAERRTGVPASFILGQAALESGWGKGEIRNADGSPSFNLFGIKATGGWKGDRAEVMTTEYEAGQPVRQRAAFRSYGSYAEAFTDYARLLKDSPRYGGVVRGASTVEQFAGGMQRAGYATDPQYASKLARTINQTLALQRAMA
jgi:flagellar protein FlgJ